MKIMIIVDRKDVDELIKNLTFSDITDIGVSFLCHV